LIVKAYDEASRGMLILGAPGAGKSTLIRELACELVNRAEKDPDHPIPVLVNLSSWATKKLPLEFWLVEQLQVVYVLPRHLSQSWIEQDQFLLLLDGLDEVEASARPTCIKCINAYQGTHFVPLVVCSRSQEYLTQAQRLTLPYAVEVQPLASEQVDDYLKSVGKPVAAVRSALGSNPVLHDLVASPLMLNVATLAYRGKSAKDLPQLGTPEEQQRQVFTHYVERMLEQRTRNWHYPSPRTKRWLIWLARQMQQHLLTEFYLERLQRSWLPTKRAQRLYPWLFGLFVGLVFGLYYGGTAFLNHFLIRFFLWRSGVMPWHYVRFLDEATERIILHPVGGGYRFIHPLFQEYFASLDTAPPAQAVTPPASETLKSQDRSTYGK
jgi:hypothetical protein